MSFSRFKRQKPVKLYELYEPDNLCFPCIMFLNFMNSWLQGFMNVQEVTVLITLLCKDPQMTAANFDVNVQNVAAADFSNF